MDGVLKTNLIRPGSGNIRAYLAGRGASGALFAGALVVFLSAAAFVAFNGFSFSDNKSDSSLSIAPSQPIAGAGKAPIAAANAVGPGASAVAATPAPVLIPGATFGPGAGGPIGPGGPTGGPGTDVPPGSNGTVGSVIDGVDGTTPSGVPDISDTTAPITGPVDNTVRDGLNQAGGAVGNPQLGDQVGDVINNGTNQVLGDGGLLGGN
jgi:hypothetical protein